MAWGCMANSVTRPLAFIDVTDARRKMMKCVQGYNLCSDSTKWKNAARIFKAEKRDVPQSAVTYLISTQ